MEKIQCPVCIHKPKAAHAWYGSGTRVIRKHRTRETEVAHAWNGNAARVKRKRRTRDTDNGCRTGLWQLPRHRNLQTADTAKHPMGTWDKYELQSTWFHCTINLILLYNQLDFTAWSTCFFKGICVKGFTLSTHLQLIVFQTIVVKGKNHFIFHTHSPSFTTSILYTMFYGETSPKRLSVMLFCSPLGERS